MLAKRGERRVTRARTTASMVGRTGEPLPEAEGLCKVVLDEGRVTERRGSVFVAAGCVVFVVDVGVDVGVGVECDVEMTGPATEAYICESWICVPGPGAYCDEGPKSWPGRAIEGSAMPW